MLDLLAAFRDPRSLNPAIESIQHHVVSVPDLDRPFRMSMDADNDAIQVRTAELQMLSQVLQELKDAVDKAIAQ